MFELSNYKDVDGIVNQIVTKYYTLRDAGKYDEAYDLLNKNKETLKHYFIDANSLNKIELGIYELAQTIHYSQKIIVSKTEPDTTTYQLNVGSEWLQEY